METRTLVYKCQIGFTELSHVNEIREELKANMKLANLCSLVDYGIDINVYLGLIRDLLELERESRNSEFFFNPLILKLIICKIELLRSNITVKSENEGLILDSVLQSAYDYLSKLLESLLDSETVG